MPQKLYWTNFKTYPEQLLYIHVVILHNQITSFKLRIVCACIIVLPSANLVLENIGSVYPFYVYDGNRPLATIPRQRQCSQLYDVC
jgi:hypothetical protein